MVSTVPSSASSFSSHPFATPAQQPKAAVSQLVRRSFDEVGLSKPLQSLCCATANLAGLPQGKGSAWTFDALCLQDEVF
jgi:hypothetical protein